MHEAQRAQQTVPGWLGEFDLNNDKLGLFWLLSTFLLIAIIITSSVVIWLHRGGEPVEIIFRDEQSKFEGEIYLEGAVSRPGIYPLRAGDNIESLLQASGGASPNADLFQVHLYIPRIGDEEKQPQKVDINRAEVWLLEALPEIGNTRAVAIIQFRQQNGGFHNIEELTQVPGISNVIFEKIKTLVTVYD